MCAQICSPRMCLMGWCTACRHAMAYLAHRELESVVNIIINNIIIININGVWPQAASLAAATHTAMLHCSLCSFKPALLAWHYTRSTSDVSAHLIIIIIIIIIIYYAIIIIVVCRSITQSCCPTKHHAFRRSPTSSKCRSSSALSSHLKP